MCACLHRLISPPLLLGSAEHHRTTMSKLIQTQCAPRPTHAPSIAPLLGWPSVSPSAVHKPPTSVCFSVTALGRQKTSLPANGALRLMVNVADSQQWNRPPGSRPRRVRYHPVSSVDERGQKRPWSCATVLWVPRQ